jgi:hypothetical protein
MNERTTVRNRVRTPVRPSHPQNILLNVERRKVADKKRLVRDDSSSTEWTPEVDDLEAGIFGEGVDSFVGGSAANDGTGVFLLERKEREGENGVDKRDSSSVRFQSLQREAEKERTSS